MMCIEIERLPVYHRWAVGAITENLEGLDGM